MYSQYKRIRDESKNGVKRPSGRGDSELAVADSELEGRRGGGEWARGGAMSE